MKILLLSLMVTGSMLNVVAANDFNTEYSTDYSYDQRLKMAGIHEQAAACLKSNRSAVDCHDEMMTACRGLENQDGCSMMGFGPVQNGIGTGIGTGHGHGRYRK